VGHGAASADGAAAALALHLPQPPSLPVFAKLGELSPPPPPDLNIHGDSVALQDIISDLSVVVFTAIVVGFFMCVYCFFAPTILSSLHRATNGKIGKVHVRSHRYVHHKLPVDEDQYRRMRVSTSTAIMPVDEPPKRKKRSGRKNGHRHASTYHGDDARRDEDPMDATGRRKVRLVVQTTAITQSKDVDVGSCHNPDALRSLFYDEFTSALKDVRPEHSQLFCLAPAPKVAVLPPSERQEDEPMAWLLVTDHSDFVRVIDCPAFRLQDKRCDEALTAQYVVAFAQSHDPQAQTTAIHGKRRQKKSRSVVSAAPPLCEPALPVEQKRSRSIVSATAPPCEVALPCEAALVPCEVALPVESRRGRSRDRRGARGCSSAPPSCVGVPCATDGADGAEDSGSDESATSSSRQSLLRGTGPTRASCIPAPDLARLAVCHAAPPPPADLTAQLAGQALTLTSSSLQQLEVSCRLPGCNSIPPRATSVAGSAWDDDDPDGTGVSRSERVRAIADLE